MTNSHDSRGILCETLFGPGNFSSWQNNVMTALGYKDLDTIVFECPKEVTPEIRLKKKQATTFIRLHLDQQNFTCFVKDPTKYKPKELWDAICDHYATKSLENVVNLMDWLYNIPFSNGDLQDSINKFHKNFWLLLEVSFDNLDTLTIETLWEIIILKWLTSSFAVMQSLQFAQYKGKQAKIPMDTFLSNLELEIQQQSKSTKVTQASAFNVSCQSSSNPFQNKNQKQQNVCKKGVHNPNTLHTPDQCHQLHPKLAIAYHQAALSRIQNETQPSKANLSLNNVNPELVILHSRASGHYLKHWEYFITFQSPS